MFGRKQIAVVITLISAMSALSESKALPDSAGIAPLPGPGLSYGGIPYGSMSGNVAEYFRGKPSFGGVGDYDFAPIEQYL